MRSTCNIFNKKLWIANKIGEVFKVRFFCPRTSITKRSCCLYYIAIHYLMLDFPLWCTFLKYVRLSIIMKSIKIVFVLLCVCVCMGLWVCACAREGVSSYMGEVLNICVNAAFRYNKYQTRVMIPNETKYEMH